MTPSQNNRNKRLWFGAGTLILIGWFAWGNLASWPVKLRYPGEQNLAEGVPLVEMLHARQGIPIYGPLSPEKFDTPSYGPLYYLLGSRLVDPGRPAFLPLRLLSLLGTLGCIAGCALLAFWVSQSAFAAAMAALLFLAYRFVTWYGISDRCDMIALLLSLSGFLVAYRFRDSRRLLWAAPLILLGFYYKQQFVAAPLAILLFLALEKRIRLALQFVALLGTGGLALLALFQFVVFHGQAFLKHFVVYVGGLPYSVVRLKLGGLDFAMLFLFPLIVAIEFLRRWPDKLLICYLAIALPQGVLIFAKEGSDMNYFVEGALVLSALFAALMAQRLGDSLATVEVLFLLILTLIPIRFQQRAEDPPVAQDFVRDQAIQTFLTQNFSPGTKAFGYYVADLARARLNAPVPAPFVYNWLVRRGFFTDQGLIDQLHTHRFGLVVLNFDLQHEQGQGWLDYYLTDGVRAAILAEYQPESSLEMPEPEKFRPEDRFYVWVPRRP